MRNKMSKRVIYHNTLACTISALIITITISLNVIGVLTALFFTNCFVIMVIRMSGVLQFGL